jgi:hypothetical protein
MRHRHSWKTVGSFEIHTLSNDTVSLSMAPELGGRVVSLRDRKSGREWLDGWSPANKRRLWHPADPADFATGPGAGIDECLPTVLPCRFGSKLMPDHGELWNTPPEFDHDPAGAFSCTWKLRKLPLVFNRNISLEEGGIRFEYRLENLSTMPIPFLWAWHSLFTWRRGDQIHFTPSVNECRTPGGETLPWPETRPGCDLSQARFKKGTTPAAKVFVGPLTEGHADIRAKNGARLSLTWPALLFPYAGIWITRGFWKGLHHWAIEPTNAPVDRLSEVVANSPSPSLSKLGAREIRNWFLIVGIGRD